MIEYLILERRDGIEEIRPDCHVYADLGWTGWGEPIPDKDLQEGLNRLGEEGWLLIGPLNSKRLVFWRFAASDTGVVEI